MICKANFRDGQKEWKAGETYTGPDASMLIAAGLVIGKVEPEPKVEPKKEVQKKKGK